MDYSLLIGVHTTEYEVNEHSRKPVGTDDDYSRLLVSKVVGPESYYVGIIDFQQKYDYSKMTERYTKVYLMGADSAGLSCIEPVAYQRRFMQKMREILLDESEFTSMRISNDTSEVDMTMNPIMEEIGEDGL